MQKAPEYVALENGSMPLPKRIWLLWFQGADEMPLLVRRCYESWIEHNPSWEVILLCDDNLHQFVDLGYLDFSYLGKASVADLIRLELLAKYGGVWVDSTCLCMRPLDSWLPGYVQSGFFAFDRPGRDRPIASWFIAAAPQNALVVRWFSELRTYLVSVKFRNREHPLAWAALHAILGRNERTALLWFSRFVHRGIRIYPYFAAHYKFIDILRRNDDASAIWAATPRLSARLADFGLRRISPLRPISDQITQEIDQELSPVYKLTWKGVPDPIPTNSLLGYLLKTSQASGSRSPDIRRQEAMLGQRVSGRVVSAEPLVKRHGLSRMREAPPGPLRQRIDHLIWMGQRLQALRKARN